jgi:DNA-binding NarL/FixJ family response regulator
MIRILLADDHDVVRRGLRHLVEEQPGWEVCAEATTGRQAVALAKQHKPDIAVLDISMPELNGLEATKADQESTSPTRRVCWKGSGFFLPQIGRRPYGGLATNR